MNWCDSNTYHNLLAVYDDLLRQHARLSFEISSAKQVENYQVVAALKQSSNQIWKICSYLYDCLFKSKNLDELLNSYLQLVNKQWNYDYRKMMQMAIEEGYNCYEDFFKELCRYAKNQEARYLKLAFPIGDEEGDYKCANCGEVYEKKDIDKGCPLCGKSGDYLIKRLF